MIQEELTINNKIEQIKAQYSLDREIAKISGLSSGIVSKYEFLTSKYVLKNYCIEKIWKELKKQTSVAQKENQDFIWFLIMMQRKTQ